MCQRRPRDDPDRALYLGIYSRDEGALEELILKYEERVLYHVYRVIEGKGESKDAEEITWKVFYTIWEEIEKFNPEKAYFWTWIWMRATYAALNFRRRKRGAIPFKDDTLEFIINKSEIEKNEGNYEETELAFNKLKESMKKILRMKYFLDLSYEEIADILSISIPAVKSRLHRAREKFKALLLEAGIL